MDNMVSFLQGAFLQGTLGAQSWLAWAAAALWGAVSVLLSPCGLVLIPVMVGYMGHNSTGGLGRAASIALAFCGGLFLNTAALGALVCWAGSLLSHLTYFMPLANYGAATLLFIFGLHLLDVIELHGHGHHNPLRRKAPGLWGAFTLGLVTGLAAGPCALSHFAPVLIAAFKSAGSAPAFSAGLIGSYALGSCAVIAIAGLCCKRIGSQGIFAEGSRGSFILSQICGWLVILAGAHFLYEA